MPPTLACPRCGAKNRVDAERAKHGQAVCGRCREPLRVEVSRMIGPRGKGDLMRALAGVS